MLCFFSYSEEYHVLFSCSEECHVFFVARNAVFSLQ